MTSPYIKRRGDGLICNEKGPTTHEGDISREIRRASNLDAFRGMIRYALGRGLKDDLARMKYEAYHDAGKALIMAEELPIEQLGAFEYMVHANLPADERGRSVASLIIEVIERRFAEKIGQ